MPSQGERGRWGKSVEVSNGMNAPRGAFSRCHFFYGRKPSECSTTMIVNGTFHKNARSSSHSSKITELSDDSCTSKVVKTGWERLEKRGEDWTLGAIVTYKNTRAAQNERHSSSGESPRYSLLIGVHAALVGSCPAFNHFASNHDQHLFFSWRLLLLRHYRII